MYNKISTVNLSYEAPVLKAYVLHFEIYQLYLSAFMFIMQTNPVRNVVAVAHVFMHEETM